MRYVPGSVWRFRHPEYQATYSINPDGFRDAKQWSSQKRPGTVRVLLLGDSFTFGQGSDYDQIWPVLAERELARKGTKVELVKAGIQGLDTRGELILMRQLVQRYSVDAVVVGFLINDLYFNRPFGTQTVPVSGAPGMGGVRESAIRAGDGNHSFHLLTLARRIVSASDAAYVSFYLRWPLVGDYFRLPLSDEATRQIQITDTLLRQVASYCDSVGKPLIVFSMPQQFQILYPKSGRSDPGIDVWYPDRHFEKLAGALGFDWVPSVDAFISASRTSKQDLFYRLDGHFTPAGNAVAARVFVDEVIPKILARTAPSSGAFTWQGGPGAEIHGRAPASSAQKGSAAR
jgi:lysophospholipase L1-like esterase